MVHNECTKAGHRTEYTRQCLLTVKHAQQVNKHGLVKLPGYMNGLGTGRWHHSSRRSCQPEPPFWSEISLTLLRPGGGWPRGSGIWWGHG